MELAAEFGVTRQTVARWVTLATQPRPDRASRFADDLDERGTIDGAIVVRPEDQVSLEG